MDGCERFASLGGMYAADSGLIERAKNKGSFYS